MYHQILTNIGFSVGLQSVLYESSGHESVAILNGFVFPVYLVFSKIWMISKDWQKYVLVTNRHAWKKCIGFSTQKLVQP